MNMNMNKNPAPKVFPLPCLLAAGLLLLTTSCSTTLVSTTTALALSATPATAFTAKYQSGGLSGEITSVARPGPPATVFQLDAAGSSLSFHLFKANRSAHLTAVILQGGKTVFQAEAPEGTDGMRLTRTRGGWQQTTF
jgi:hypothetical protein